MVQVEIQKELIRCKAEAQKRHPGGKTQHQLRLVWRKADFIWNPHLNRRLSHQSIRQTTRNNLISSPKRPSPVTHITLEQRPSAEPHTHRTLASLERRRQQTKTLNLGKSFSQRSTPSTILYPRSSRKHRRAQRRCCFDSRRRRCHDENDALAASEAGIAARWQRVIMRSTDGGFQRLGLRFAMG